MSDFESRFVQEWPTERWQDLTVLLAISGGADSVALARAAVAVRPAAAAGRLVIAHFNHGLRAEESAGDEQFVHRLAAACGLQCRVGHAGSGARKRPASGLRTAERADNRQTDAAAGDRGNDRPTSEERARDARYQFLSAAAEEVGARYIVTAHTADDQAETVLHHIVRGTGLAGLAGIPRVRELTPGISLVRPLLVMRRAEILAYLESLQQPYREDSSNQTSTYTRNRLRHALLPLLATDYNPRIVDSLLRLSQLAGDAQAAVDLQATKLAARCLMFADRQQVVLYVDPLAEVSRYLARETLIAAWRAQDWPRRAMGFEQWDTLAELALEKGTPRTVRRVFPGEILAERSGTRLTLTRANA